MTYRPSEETAERLRQIAFVTRRSKQSIIDEAVQDWLDTKGSAALVAYRAKRAKEK